MLNLLLDCRTSVQRYCNEEVGEIWQPVYPPSSSPLSSLGVDSAFWRQAPEGVKWGGVEVSCTRAAAQIVAPANVVFNTYWNSEEKWNRATLSSFKVLEDSNSSQLVPLSKCYHQINSCLGVYAAQNSFSGVP